MVKNCPKQISGCLEKNPQLCDTLCHMVAPAKSDYVSGILNGRRSQENGRQLYPRFVFRESKLEFTLVIFVSLRECNRVCSYFLSSLRMAACHQLYPFSNSSCMVYTAVIEGQETICMVVVYMGELCLRMRSKVTRKTETSSSKQIMKVVYRG